MNEHCSRNETDGIQREKCQPKINAYIHHQPSQPGKETRANLRGLSLARGQRKKMDSWITER